MAALVNYVVSVRPCIRRLIACDRGSGLAEYGLLATLIAIAALGGILSFSGSLSDLYNTVSAEVTSIL